MQISIRVPVALLMILLVQVAAAEPMGDLNTTPMQDFRTSTEVNVIGSVQLVKAVAPAMERAGGGAIVLIGSQSTELPPPSPQQPKPT